MKILCISDQLEGSNHSAVEGIFARYLREWCEVDVVYFSKKSSAVTREKHRIIVPYTAKHRGARERIEEVVRLEEYDWVVVRNFYSVASQLLALSNRSFKIAFWETFPHDLRRVIEAPHSWRKRIEFWFKNRRNCAILERVDLFLTVTDGYAKEYYPLIKTPVYVLPMGIDEAEFQGKLSRKSRALPLKMVYTGTIDAPRKVVEIAKILASIEGEFQVDFFTRSQNECVEAIKNLGDSRLRVLDGIGREALFERLLEYHVGIGIIPAHKLYVASLPTKTVEYAALGVIPLINHLPEYDRLFDDECAFFCDFNQESIRRAVEEILHTSFDRLEQLSQKAKERSRDKDYRVIAERFYHFLSATRYSFPAIYSISSSLR